MSVFQTVASRGKRLHEQIGWLELCLTVSALALFFQIVPSAWRPVFRVVDFRNWSSRTWRIGGLVLLVLFVFQFRSAAVQRRAVRRAAIGVGIVLLFASLAAAIMSFVPGALSKTFAAVDPRNWSSIVWFVVLAANVFAMIVIRQLPEWKTAWKKRRAELAMQEQRELEANKRRELRLRREELSRRAKRGIDFY
jgi:hypothetical protein